MGETNKIVLYCSLTCSPEVFTLSLMNLATFAKVTDRLK